MELDAVGTTVTGDGQYADFSGPNSLFGMNVTAGAFSGSNVSLTFRQIAGSRAFTFTGTVGERQMVGRLSGHVFNSGPDPRRSGDSGLA